MSLPHILLVDDSEAILAYEKAALSGHYTLSTATNGVEALEKIPLLRPHVVLLDLSMPQMDGEDVLQRCKADAELAKIPFIVVSAEHDRARKCFDLGASAILPKPIRAEELLALVSRVLDEARQQAQDAGLAALLLSVGNTRVGLPLGKVHSVVLQPTCRPLPIGPFYMSEVFEFRGQPVCVLDLPKRLGLQHSRPIAERKLVLLDFDGSLLALNVDDVNDPEEFPASHVTPRENLAGTAHAPLADALIAMLSTDEGPVPIVDPTVFLSDRALRDLYRHLGRKSEGADS